MEDVPLARIHPLPLCHSGPRAGIHPLPATCVTAYAPYPRRGDSRSHRFPLTLSESKVKCGTRISHLLWVWVPHCQIPCQIRGPQLQFPPYPTFTTPSTTSRPSSLCVSTKASGGGAEVTTSRDSVSCFT